MKKLNITSIAFANLVVFSFLMAFILKGNSQDSTPMGMNKMGIIMIIIGLLQAFLTFKIVKYKKEQDSTESTLERLRRISDDVNSESPTYEFKNSKFDDDLLTNYDDNKINDDE